MNWLERYVGAVKNYLPRKNREDVGEELTSVLQDKLEAEEESRGKKLGENELKSWIETQDHPMVVAAGYQESREIISAELIPLYIYVLKIAFVLVFGLKVFSAGFYILSHDDVEFLKVSARLFGGLLMGLISALGSITLIFHFVGQHLSTKKLFKNWKADKLPKSWDKWAVVPYGETIFGIVLGVFMLAYVNSFFIGNWDFFGWTQALTLNPGLKEVVRYINIALVLGIAFKISLLLKPYWTTLKLGASIALSLFGLWILAMILGFDPIVTFDPALVAEHPGLNRLGGLDKIIKISLYIAGGSFLFEIFRNLYRMYLLKR